MRGGKLSGPPFRARPENAADDNETVEEQALGGLRRLDGGSGEAKLPPRLRRPRAPGALVRRPSPPSRRGSGAIAIAGIPPVRDPGGAKMAASSLLEARQICDDCL